YEKLGIPTIATVQWTTDRVLRRILPDAPATEWTDPSAGVVLVERPVAAGWAGRRLADLDVAGLARVAALARLGVGQVPSPDLVTQEGDVVYMTVVADRLAELDLHLAGDTTAGGHA
ncbi:MAG: TrkA family potassium uptake protein, partial [Acidimicrobiales bacterium]